MNNLNPVNEIPGGIKVLGVQFQAFVCPRTHHPVFSRTHHPVFSQRGVARALEISESSVRRLLASDDFKLLRGENSPRTTLLTTNYTRPISVVTQTDLAFLVQIAAERGFPVAKSMQDASFAVLLQQSVDEALNIERPRKTYLEEGATLRQRLEYRYSYQGLKNTTFQKGHGVTGLSKANRQVSSLAVSDADQRRARNKNWRQFLSTSEMLKTTIGNTVHQRALDASNRANFDAMLAQAGERSKQIYYLLEQPFVE